jgi:membrane-bound lytic murein transglycosylase D
LRLPTASTTQFVDLEDSIIRYKHDQFFSGDFKLIVPTSFRNGRYGHIPSLKYFKRIFYTVKQGETMSEIAQANQIRLSDLKSWNDIYHNTLRSGQVLVLYVPKKKASNSPTAIADTSSKIVASADGFIYYQVKTGDSLWKIANQFPGVTDEDIRKWNNLTSGNKILPGQTIKIKKMN